MLGAPLDQLSRRSQYIRVTLLLGRAGYPTPSFRNESTLESVYSAGWVDEERLNSKNQLSQRRRSHFLGFPKFRNLRLNHVLFGAESRCVVLKYTFFNFEILNEVSSR